MENIRSYYLCWTYCLYLTSLLSLAYKNLLIFFMLSFVLSIGTVTKLSWRPSKDLLTLSFLIVVVDDLIFMYLWLRVSILSSNNLVTEVFHSVNSNLFMSFFRSTFCAFINTGKDTFLIIMKVYSCSFPIFRLKTFLY